VSLRHPQPLLRLLLLVEGTFALVYPSTIVALALSAATLLLLLWLLGHLKQACSLLAMTIVPVGAMLFVIWGFLVEPSDFGRVAIVESQYTGRSFAIYKTLQIANALLCFLAALGTFSLDHAPSIFRSFGLPKIIVIILVAAFALVHNIRHVANQNLIALRANGILIPSMRSRIMALPILMRNVWHHSLEAALNRVDYKWIPQKTLDDVHDFEHETVTTTSTSISFILQFSIFTLGLFYW